MPTGGGGTPPADAGPATCSCSGGHPPAPAGSVADASRPDTSRPDTDLVDTDRGSGNSSGQQGVRGVRFRSRRCGAAAGPRRLDLLVCAGHVVRSTQPAENGCPNARTPDAACRTPGARTPRHCGHPRPPQGMGTLRQRPRWTADSRTVHHPATVSRPERDPNVRHRPPRPADRQIRSLMLYVDLVGSRRIWPAHVGWPVDPDGSRPVPSDRLDDQQDDQAHLRP